MAVVRPTAAPIAAPDVDGAAAATTIVTVTQDGGTTGIGPGTFGKGGITVANGRMNVILACRMIVYLSVCTIGILVCTMMVMLACTTILGFCVCTRIVFI